MRSLGLRLAVFAAAMMATFAAPAGASVTRTLGPTGLFFEPKVFVKFDVAYDSVNHLYLAVWGTNLASPVNGLFLNDDGVPVGTRFDVSAPGWHSGFARVLYSPEEGKFIVSYTKIVAMNVHQKVARFISTNQSGTPFRGREMVLDAWAGNAGSANGLAYASASRRFFVTWARYVGNYPVSFVATFDPNAIDPVSGEAGVVTASGMISNPADGQSDPEIDCDPLSRRCLIVGTSWGVAPGSVVYPQAAKWYRFITDTGAPLGDGSAYFMVAPSLPDPPAISYNTASGNFVVGFARSAAIWGLIVNGSTQEFRSPFVMIQPQGGDTDGGGYGFLSLRYNAGTQTSLATMGSWLGVAAVQELDGHGLRTTGGFDIIPDTPEGKDIYNTRNQYSIAAGNPNKSQFLVLDNHYFKVMRASLYQAASGSQPPSVTLSPSHVTVRRGQGASFAAAATGSPTPSLQWQKSGDGGSTWTDINGATSATLSFTVTGSDNHKLFRAKFTNSAGQALTTAARLTVLGGSPDFDGDGRPDPLVWRPSDGTFYWSNSSADHNSNTPAVGTKQWGDPALGDVVLSGDIDGDNLGDLIVWRPSNGTWYWLTSSTGYNYANANGVQWGNGSLGDVPILADVDNDGKSDLIVWRASSGTWYWLTSSSGYNYAAQGQKQWGNQSLGDKPLTGDFDGDGAADLAVWRASSGTWFWLTSSSGYAYPHQAQKQWGNVTFGDIPLLGDIDGDGRSDLVVWRASSGTWFWLTSSSGYDYGQQAQKQWGNGSMGDSPMLTDFDGDGLADLVVFRPAAIGTWFWLTSSSGYSYLAQAQKQFGSAGDIPLIR